MDYKIELVTREAQPALIVRKTVTAERLRHEIGSAYATIASYLIELGVSDPGKPFVAYHNMDMHNLDVEMGFVTEQEFPGHGDVIAGEIPSGQWVTFIHKGPYKDMGHGYAVAAHWMQQQGINPKGIAYEHYLNDPSLVPEAELLTRVEFAV